MSTTRRLLSIFVVFCLIFSQTAQAYSFAWLPHQYRHSIAQGQRISITSGRDINVVGSSASAEHDIKDQWGQTRLIFHKTAAILHFTANSGGGKWHAYPDSSSLTNPSM